jgi:hypothetical protein
MFGRVTYPFVGVRVSRETFESLRRIFTRVAKEVMSFEVVITIVNDQYFSDRTVSIYVVTI